MTQLLPPKKEVALALLENSNVDVYLDPRATGVVVPPQFRKEPRLILKIGLNMPVPIPDLHLDDESMSCTLSFNRARFYCVVPWASVFAIVGEEGRGMVWPEDVPQELAVRPADEPPPPAKGLRQVPQPSQPDRARARGRSKLAEDPPKRASAELVGPASRAKRTKKKKDDGRPGLAAVPDAMPAPTVLADHVSAKEAAKEAAREAAAAQEGEPGAAGAGGGRRGVGKPAPAPAGGAGRPKRELPPYLRVVK
jgi:stringent starvation protein B